MLYFQCPAGSITYFYSSSVCEKSLILQRIVGIFTAVTIFHLRRVGKNHYIFSLCGKHKSYEADPVVSFFTEPAIM